MRTRRRIGLLATAFAALAIAFAAESGAQGRAQAKGKAKTDSALRAKAAKDSANIAKALRDSGRVGRFFRSETPITATLTTNIGRIRSDKAADAPWRAATLSYAAIAPDTGTVRVPVRIRTRGVWRLKTCEFPPIRLNFTSEAVKGTELRGLDEPKLVNYCRNTDEYERYILQELQLYRIYRLITPASHAVRLLRLAYTDSASGKVAATRYAFIVEEPDALAARLGGRVLEATGAGPNDLEPYADAVLGVFQYLIGNTDFGLSALHNAELLALPMGEFVPVAYDFDFAGAVDARYATVDPRLAVRRVRDRLYRGYCVPPEIYPRVFARFNAQRDSIYALYADAIGKLLGDDTVKETLAYFDEFYKIINDPKTAKSEIIDQCLGGKR